MSSRKRRSSKPMLIDWFTVAAQALNFGVLVWLMKRNLYKPILAAIDAREALVSAELANAATKSRLADQAAESFERKNSAFDLGRAVLVAKATEEGQAAALRILESARLQADELQDKRRASLEREAMDFASGLRQSAQQTFFSLARRVFKDLANGSLEEQVTARFCEQLRNLRQSERATFDAALGTSGVPARIRMAFAMPSDQQQRLRAAVDETFGRAIPLRFEVAPDLVSGIELAAQGQRLGWSIADYLVELEAAVRTAGSRVARGSPGGPPAPAAAPALPAAL